jgi:pimeloyl-ACP methyl ester carboxylesterase
MLNGKYAGVLGQDKKTIDGTWFQGKAAFPLTVTKTSDTATVKQQRRPQTPTPPFPYQIRDVEYWNADKSIQYAATLTYPIADPGNPGKKNFPAVILITGSGQQDRDEMLFGHKPFAVIADNLTKHGFLVLRVDDRGMGKTTGDFSQATSLDFAKDVEAGLDFLEAQPEVNKANIGLLGHSEGGLIAPIIAGERKEVKFIVLLAGPGTPTVDLNGTGHPGRLAIEKCTVKDKIYSPLKLFTGLATAALITWKLIVTSAISKQTAPTVTNIHQPILIR